ncbi:MAG: hypothetical protein UX80_C0031G0002 [Candidatus Amesbacteria bacterium GW2011_GWA2_47_11b]|uniref:Uncharacterized protein n=1 Tax=Candidatus Amesbacteria bacterium GW2011_GWA2_47_11b TaxID=1618358 RepID=A0A0G1RI29_9BACT|nr:MAG: hypothetical protein UX80_C0031G0002 [Candidatus Amesbacteria bacterium GW2011_GWA2_47_11b]
MFSYFLVRRRYLLFSIFYFLSTTTHPGVLLWLPWLIYIAPSRRSSILYSLISILVGTVSFIPKLGEHVQFSLLPTLRNILIPTLRNNTNLIVILSLIAAVQVLWIERAGGATPSGAEGKAAEHSQPQHRTATLILLWLGPTLITNQWWDSLFFGRHALIASFGLAYLTALLISNHKFLISITIAYLLLTSVPALSLLRGPIPYLEEAKFAATLPPDGIYVTSHFARPQLQGVYRGTTIFVNEPGWAAKLPATASALYISPGSASSHRLFSHPPPESNSSPYFYRRDQLSGLGLARHSRPRPSLVLTLRRQATTSHVAFWFIRIGCLRSSSGRPPRLRSHWSPHSPRSLLFR